MERQRGVERRIGTRVHVEPIDVVLRFRSASARLFGLRSPKVVERSARIVEVSVSGALVEGPDEPELQPGTDIAIRVDGHDSAAKVRRRVPGRRPGVVGYGVEFLRLDDGLQRTLHDLLDRRRA